MKKIETSSQINSIDASVPTFSTETSVSVPFNTTICALGKIRNQRIDIG
jgi:hypothetical protein